MKDLCYFAYEQEVYNDDPNGDAPIETCVQGYWSGQSEDRFFRDISKMICFDDIEPRTVVEIVWHGKKVFYRGWKPGMLYQYEDENGELVWEGHFPEWDH